MKWYPTWLTQNGMNVTIANWTARYKLPASVTKASPEQIAFDDNRVDKNQVLRLADCEFIKRHENIIITGSTGIGKKFSRFCSCHQACALGNRVLYQHSTKLFARMKIAKAGWFILKGTG